MKHTLVLAYPGCIAFEVMLATELLHPSYPLEIASPDGEPLVNSNGMRIDCELAYDAVDPERYRCILVPGGDPGQILGDPDVQRILRASEATIIGGICAGVLVMASTGLLEGRRMTHNYTKEQGAADEMVSATEHFWKEADRVNEPVVKDGRLVTAWPNAHVEFAVTVAELAGAIDADRAAQLRTYHRG